MHNDTHKIQDFSQYVMTKLTELWNGILLKLGITTVVAFPVTFLGVEWHVIIALVGLGFLDFVTGLIKAKKKGQPIQSKKMLNSAYKAVLYASMIFASYLMTQVFPDYVALHKYSATFLILVEFHSVIENITQAGVLLPIEVRDWLKAKINIKDE